MGSTSVGYKLLMCVEGNDEAFLDLVRRGTRGTGYIDKNSLLTNTYIQQYILCIHIYISKNCSVYMLSYTKMYCYI